MGSTARTLVSEAAVLPPEQKAAFRSRRAVDSVVHTLWTSGSEFIGGLPVHRRSLTAFAFPVVLLVGCRGDEPPEATGTTRPTTTATSEEETAASGSTTSEATAEEATTPDSAVPAEEQAVLDAYQSYWRAYYDANDPPDQGNPVLREFATGEAFDSVFMSTQANRLAGRALRLPDESISLHDARVLTLDGEQATVEDCSVDDGQVVELSTGTVLDDDIVSRHSTAELVVERGQWKVARTSVQQTWEGVAGCAL